MPRSCNCCNAAEIRLALDARLTAGESHTELAREYGFSPDAVGRHHKNHVVARKSVAPTIITSDDLYAKLSVIWDRANALFESASALNDPRAAIDALTKLMQTAESMNRISSSHRGFEGLSMAEKAEFVCSDGELYRSVLDFNVRTADAFIRDHGLQSCSVCHGRGYVSPSSPIASETIATTQ